MRHSSSYSVPYNPQDWGPMGSAPVDAGQSSSVPGSRMLRINPRLESRGPHTDVSLSPPPPPYSPPHSQHQSGGHASDNSRSGAGAGSPAAGSSYGSASTHTASEPFSGYGRAAARNSSRPLSMVHVNDSRSSTQMALPPPPPLPPLLSQRGLSSRSSSEGREDAQRMMMSHNSSQGVRSRLSITVSPGDEEDEQEEEENQKKKLQPDPEIAPFDLPVDVFSKPPSSRRAVSAGAVFSNASSLRVSRDLKSLSPPRHSWEPGMPLPPPPPGPPPGTASRLPSGNGQPESSSGPDRTVSGGFRSRQRPSRGTGLGSIPPTPAGWIDEQAGVDRRQARDNVGLHVDTKCASQTSQPDESQIPTSSHNESAILRQRPASGGLFRSPALRDASAKGIRERRIERRHRQSLVSEHFSETSSSTAAGAAAAASWTATSDEVMPSNLVLSSQEKTTDDQTRFGQLLVPAFTSYYPGQSSSSDEQRTTAEQQSRASSSTPSLFSNKSSSLSTPKAEPSPVAGITQTPPFSPSAAGATAKLQSQTIPPKALPTPPPHSASARHQPSSSRSKIVDDVDHNGDDHLGSDLLLSLPVVLPLSPRRQSSEQTTSLGAVVGQDAVFMQQAVQRHQQFIEREVSAVNETEALQIFADFIVAESRIRRERYSHVWTTASSGHGPIGFDVDAVCQKLFELPLRKQTSDPSSMKLDTEMPSFSPGSTAAAADVTRGMPESAWWTSYQPCLSPIASMSISNDEMSSRGRAPSRWWESKSGSDGGERKKLQRSNRESKYMGLPRELREAMQWSGPGQAALPSMKEEEQQQRQQHALEHDSHAPDRHNYAYGPDEYPPEKAGWHEEAAEPAPLPLLASEFSSFGRPHGVETTQKMDVSRLITLPPPYPRHHPAVNNSHPDLVTYRTTVRSITDLSEIKATRQRHGVKLKQARQEHGQRMQESRRQFKSNIHSQIEQGGISYAEAAEAEAAMKIEEQKLDRDLAKIELDMYQESVFEPLQSILADRIGRATSCIDQLSNKLFDDARHETPDQAQEEGDEKPELLEKLTQLKWLFEAREQLHLEMFDLISERNEIYHAVVSLPYRQSSNSSSSSRNRNRSLISNSNSDSGGSGRRGEDSKIRETTAFFAKDASDRRAQYEGEALQRLESFLDVIERNVVRGVEIQLSAFWDIAPSLLALVQSISEELRKSSSSGGGGGGGGGAGTGNFQILIPMKEYDENPMYHEHPLQYLYSLLLHAERSSYQYIESQINLLCLLHEVKSAVMRAHCKLLEAERIRGQGGEGSGSAAVHDEMQIRRVEEERLLTADLKDKVAMVEEQWAQALGSHIEALREQVKQRLVAEGGWEQMEQMD